MCRTNTIVSDDNDLRNSVILYDLESDVGSLVGLCYMNIKLMNFNVIMHTLTLRI